MEWKKEIKERKEKGKKETKPVQIVRCPPYYSIAVFEVMQISDKV